jgi:hypothetical protein
MTMAVSNLKTVLGGTSRFAGALAVFLALGVGVVKADQFAYISNTVSQNILAWDVTTNTFAGSPVVVSTGPIDSLEFTSANQLVYSVIGNNTLGEFNCPGGFSSTTGLCMGPSTNTTLSSAAGLNQPSDIVEDPSNTSIWVSNAGTKTITQVSLANGAILTTCNINNMRPDGLSFVGSNLYAVLQTTGLGEELAQINTATPGCSVTNSIALPSENGTNSMADGLTWNPAAAGGLTTGSFYVASDDGGVYQVNQALTSVAYTQLLTPAGASNKEFDGITSNLATLYIINRDIGGVTYALNAATGAVIPGAIETSPFSNGADDIAAVASTPSFMSPEPTTMFLFGAGMMAIGFARRSRRKSGSA